MKVPYTWLKEYVETDLEPLELANRLTMAGLEVDRVERRWPNIVTARITFLEPVRGSDHLNATRVTTGDGAEHSVVCGASNIHLGDMVPLALPGAEVLAENGETFTIGVTKKRGILSEGMLCSPRELGLSTEHAGIYLLPPETPPGQPLDETIIELDIKAHRGDLFGIVSIAREVAAFNHTRLRPPSLVVPERGQRAVADLLRVTIEATDLCPRFTARVIHNARIAPAPLWMVRRLAAAGVRSINNVVDITNYVMLELGQPLHAFDYDRVAEGRLIVRRARAGERLTTLDGQDRALTPDTLLVCDPTGPLSLAGVMGGAASEITPATTTILLEAATWDPTTIRRTSTRLGLRSEASSRFEKRLDPELARQGLDRAAQLLAEIAGGVVAPGVVDVYPAPVRPRDLRFSARDCVWLLGYPITPGEAAGALRALEFGVALDDDGGDGMTVTVPTWRGDVREAADLVEEVARVLGYDRIQGAIPSGPLPEPQPLSWFDREMRVRDILAGAGLREIVTYPLTSRAAMAQLLSDASDATPLLIGATTPTTAADGAKAKGKGKGKRGAEVAAPAGSALATAAERVPAIVLANPLNANLEALRLTLLVSLMENLAENMRQGAASIRVFEVGRRYIPNRDPNREAPTREPTAGDSDGLPIERRSIGVALTGPINDDWHGAGRDQDFFDLKAVAAALFAELHVGGARYTPTQHPTFHPGRCALIELPVGPDASATTPAGIMGEIHPEVARRYGLPRRALALELDLERLYDAAPARPRFQPISRFPALTRDIALIVADAVAASDVAAAIHESGGALVRSVALFDVYTGEQIPAGKRSLAFAITYQADDRTLTDADGDAERAKVVALLRQRFDAVIRE